MRQKNLIPSWGEPTLSPRGFTGFTGFNASRSRFTQHK